MWIRAAITGSLAAAAFSIALISILLVSGDGGWAIYRATWFTIRAAAYLLLAGAVVGAVLLRRWPPHWMRLVLTGALSFGLSVTVLFTVQQYTYDRWREQIFSHDIRPGMPERELVARLGEPTRVVTRSDPSWQPGCSRGTAVKQLEYSHGSGGVYRLFAIDRDGRVVCDSLGMRHIF